MYLKKLHISNFRCFRDYTIEFAPRVTVLFGKNGSGKSTLIHAIHKALSMLMYTKNIHETVIVKGKRKKKLIGYKTITNNNPYLHPKGFATDDFNNQNDAFIEVEAIADFDQTLSDVNWKISVKANSNKLRPTEFEDAFLAFYSWQEQGGQLPLLAYISDSFPHKQDNKKSKVKAKIRELRNFAYFNWDEEEGCTNEWIVRLENNLKQQISLLAKGFVNNRPDGHIMAELRDDDRERFESLKSESDSIESYFKKFSSNVLFTSPSAINFEHFALGRTKQNEGKLCIQTVSGGEYDFRKLPAGYKRLFNIVLDLAYRSFILSEERSIDIPGIVIIDEIDLHLHPQLEQVVLMCLTKAFPSLQFIVSTHSLLVLTELKTEELPNVILYMRGGDVKPNVTHDIYGIDYNTGIEDVMGVQSKNTELDYMVGLCAYMQSRKKDEQTENIIRRIIEKFSKTREEVEKMVESKVSKL